jgi:L-alanine-DL-glutamate epimerase-like enolase superfamily enzyme
VKVASVEPIAVSVPYRHREVSAQVARDGVSDVLVRVETEDGLVGWGEACSGADLASVEAVIRAMAPFVVGRDVWNGEAMRGDLWQHGLWQYRPMTGNFAWAGIDMALWDVKGKAVGEPVYRLLGGLRRTETSYFYYLARGSADELAEQCADSLAADFDVFYLKVGIDFRDDLAMVAAVREALGDEPRIRLDANGAWSVPEARRFLELACAYGLDFVEQPVGWQPVSLMAELRGTVGTAICANEGLWTEENVVDRIRARAADVLLTLPSVVDGHQQTAYLMQHDVLREPLPIASAPRWGVPRGPGLGVEVDEDAVTEAAERYRREGQFLPWQPELLARAQL